MLQDDLRRRVSWEPERLPPETAPSQMAWGFSVVFVFIFVLLLLTFAHAMDHGFDPNDPVVQWFESLKQPDSPRASCCGKADAYPVRIEQEPVGDAPDQMGTAVVTDGSPIKFPDGKVRTAIPNGTTFNFPLSKLNQLKDGNPTKTAWSFMSYYSDTVQTIWCVIPLPPGS